MAITRTVTTLDGNTIVLIEDSNPSAAELAPITARSVWVQPLPELGDGVGFLPISRAEISAIGYGGLPFFNMKGGGGSTRVEDGLSWPRGSNRFGA